MRITLLIIAGAVALNLGACGYKGNLKTPAQIAQDNAKKAAEEQKQQDSR